MYGYSIVRVQEKINEQEKQISRYKDMWLSEKVEKEKYKEVNNYYEKFIKYEGLLIDFNKKYTPR